MNVIIIFAVNTVYTPRLRYKCLPIQCHCSLRIQPITDSH